jgi:hypothetical protein
MRVLYQKRREGCFSPQSSVKIKVSSSLILGKQVKTRFPKIAAGLPNPHNCREVLSEDTAQIS